MLRKKSLSQFSQTQSLHVNWDACLQRSSKLVWLTKLPILPMPTDDCFYKTLTAAVPLFHLHSIFPGQAITGLPPTNQFPWDYDVWRGRIKICFIWPHSRAAPPPPLRPPVQRCYSLRRDEWWGGGACVMNSDYLLYWLSLMNLHTLNHIFSCSHCEYVCRIGHLQIHFTRYCLLFLDVDV